MNTKELLEKRRVLKKKKPEFIRQDAHKKAKVGWKWRKPRGSDSKMRVRRKGYKRSVTVGWKSPASIRGSGKEGLNPFTVMNLKDIEKADPKLHVIVIPSGVGKKKKLVLLEKAISKGIKVENFKEPQKFIEDVKREFEKKKRDKEKLKQEREKKREAVKKEAQKKKEKEKEEKEKETAEAKGKEKKEEEMTEEEKKMEEKKEKDKLLISTQ